MESDSRKLDITFQQSSQLYETNSARDAKVTGEMKWVDEELERKDEEIKKLQFHVKSLEQKLEAVNEKFREYVKMVKEKE